MAPRSIEDFLQNVLAQQGDRYQLGVDNPTGDADPDAWDGSELVEWAANRAGVPINDGAQNQFKQMVHHKGNLSVDDAMRTPGAVLYEFDGDPMGAGRPSRASTAISLGDGKHIIDIDPVEGVRIIDASTMTFTHAGVLHGFEDARSPGPMSQAMVEDALEQVGLEPGPAFTPIVPSDDGTGGDATPPPTPTGTPTSDPTPDPAPTTDPAPPPAPSSPPAPPAPPAGPIDNAAQPPDTPEIAALAARAAQLRDRYNATQSSPERIELVDQRNEAGRRAVLAEHEVELAQMQAADASRQVTELRELAKQRVQAADEAAKAGRHTDAEELREQAAGNLATAKTAAALAERANADITRLQQAEAPLKRNLDDLSKRVDQWDVEHGAAEKAIDSVEDRVRLLREAELHEARAAGHREEAQWFRDNGDPQEAANREALAAREMKEAEASTAASRAVQVDEAALRKTGILAADEPVASADLDAGRSLLDDEAAVLATAATGDGNGFVADHRADVVDGDVAPDADSGPGTDMDPAPTDAPASESPTTGGILEVAAQQSDSGTTDPGPDIDEIPQPPAFPETPDLGDPGFEDPGFVAESPTSPEVSAQDEGDPTLDS